ncbi:MAG: D-amino-acid transaminase [Bacillaceae bacterium]|nr:D-amino-acid transaminase [Bacillaceae bacterium]
MKILWNDRIVDRNECRIDPEDRGYQFGDGIYEVISFYNHQLFKLTEHMERLSYSAGEIAMDLPYSTEQIAENLKKLVELSDKADGQIYLQVTRGYAPRNHALPEKADPVLTAYLMHHPRPLDAQKTGVAAVTAEDVRWLRCDIKSLNLLGSILAKQKAVENGASETILHRGGTVTEGSSTNVFMVKNNTIYTHPINNLILNGITRRVVRDLAEKADIPFREEAFTTDDLMAADEVFLSSTIMEIMPVVRVDGQTIGTGRPGKVTKTLVQLFHEFVN